jgi:hypothetical protein
MYFWIHIVPSHSPVEQRFMFSIANMQGPGGAAPYITFDSMDSLTVSMRLINVHDDDISEMRSVLATGNPFSLPNVYLTDEDLRKLSFYVLGNVPERTSSISAVEGLKLDSEGVERLERTKGLRPEERRAETIQAFAQSRNRE